MRRSLSLSLALILTFFLAACDTAEERAEQHYESAVSLLAEGDTDRAIVELRNVFQQVGNHFEARHLLASVLLNEKEDRGGAYRQYLRLSEQYPDDLKARTELAELAFYASDWDELTRHGSKAREISPEDTDVQIIAAAMDYRTAALDDDTVARAQVIANAQALLDPAAPNRLLRELILDDAMRRQELTEAMSILDGMTADYPLDEKLWRQRLQILLVLGDQDAIEAQLIDLVERFPDNVEQRQTLVRYYLSRNELDKTETFLRQLVDDAPAGENLPRVDLIRFLLELRGVDDARAEIDDAIASADDSIPFLVMSAALDFQVGNTDNAIKTLEDAIDGAEPSEQLNSMKTTLAQMLLQTGNQVGARALVEAVLLDDPNNSAALKMSAEWLIDADETDAAISALRTALDNDADDADALTLMASAYTRQGSIDLASDFLSLAVEASGSAPAETLRYVQVLLDQERYLSAEDVLLPALRIAPNDLGLLRAAGRLYLAMDDLGRMQQVIETMRRVDTPEANQIAVQLETERLNRSGGTDEAMNYLEGLAQGQDSDMASQIMLLRARISTGDLVGAVSLAEDLVAEAPDAPGIQLMLANTLVADAQYDRALEIYRSVAETVPDQTNLKVEIAQIQVRAGDPAGARETVTAALQGAPEDPGLLWANASFQELDGDIDAAIATYQQLYAVDSNNIIIANNLASLIGTYRDDPDSLEQAWTIARRFRDTELAAIQDTYGWIAHRRGDSNDALPYLQSAAAELVDDPVVQFHLGEALFALNQLEDALVQYRKTLEIAGVGDTRPMVATAGTRIAEIEAALAAQEASETE